VNQIESSPIQRLLKTQELTLKKSSKRCHPRSKEVSATSKKKDQRANSLALKAPENKILKGLLKKMKGRLPIHHSTTTTKLVRSKKRPMSKGGRLNSKRRKIR